MNFADELAAFRTRTAAPGYRALILLGTRQAITAALLIGTLALERVAFLLTKDTQKIPDQVVALLGCSSAGWFCPEGDHSTTLRVYEGVKAIMERWGDLDRRQIVVDVTGGLKPMSVGLEKAAHLLGLATIYIESDYGPLPDGKFGPIAGSQRLIVPPDPYAVFGDLEAAEARRLYVAHDYAGARRIFERLAAHVPPPDDARYQALAQLAAMYAAWDVLDFAAAEQHAAVLLAQEPDHLPLLAEHRAVLTEQHIILHRLVSVAAAVVQRDDQARNTLADPEAVLPLLGTLHTAALRRAAQGRYDFAALFRYRCLELISQHRLATHGLLSHRPQYRQPHLNHAQLTSAFQEIQKTVGRKDLRKPPERNIALFDGYMLLAALDDPLVHGYAIKRIEERSDARNHSVLAHGYQLIGQEEYERFAGVVDEILDRLFTQVLGQPRAQWERASRFVEPFTR